MSEDGSSKENLPTFGVTAEAKTDTRTVVETRGFEFIVDEPEAAGGSDEGPNPVEYQAGALAGCLNVVGHVVADEMGIDLDGLAFEVAGELDPKKYLGHDPDVRAGYQELRVEVTAETDADDETVEAWIAAVEERCPVTDNLVNETPVEVSVTAE